MVVIAEGLMMFIDITNTYPYIQASNTNLPSSRSLLYNRTTIKLKIKPRERKKEKRSLNKYNNAYIHIILTNPFKKLTMPIDYQGAKVPTSYATCSIGYKNTHTLPEKLKAIASAGFDGIELSMPDILSYGAQLHNGQEPAGVWEFVGPEVAEGLIAEGVYNRSLEPTGQVFHDRDDIDGVD